MYRSEPVYKPIKPPIGASSAISSLHLILTFLVLILVVPANAANRFWVGGGGNWNVAANWSASSGGAGGAGVPGAGDNAIFDGAGGGLKGASNCTINTSPTVLSILMQATYANAVSLGANTLTIANGGNFTHQGGTFNVNTGVLTLNQSASFNLSGGTFNANSGTVNVNTAFSILTTCTVTLSGGTFNGGSSTINLGGLGSTANWVVNGGTFNPNTSTVNLTTTSLAPQTISGTSAAQSFYNLVVNGGGVTISGVNLLTLNILNDYTQTTGNFTPGPLTTMTITNNYTQTASNFASPATLNVGGNFAHNTGVGTFTAGTLTVFNGGGAQTISSTANALEIFNNVTVFKAGGTLNTGGTIINLTFNGDYINTLGNFTPPATLSISGNVTLTAGTLSAGTNILVGGNWSNNGGTFTNNNNTVTLNGTAAAQTVGGSAATPFYNLTLNNTFATIPQIVLGISTTATNNLTMTSGVVNLAGFTFTLGASATASSLTRTASTTTNWMYGGTFRRFWLTATAVSSSAGNFYGLFPVGSSTASSYRPVAINSNASPTGTGSFSVTHTNATTSTDLSPFYSDAGTNIVRKNDAQFVTATTATGGTYDIAVTMTGLLAGTLSDIRLAVSNAATTVTDFGTHLAATGTAPNPTAARTGGLITLAQLVGDWRITTTNKAATPLPIELLSFSAAFHQRRVQLDWSTASELNNDFFTVERASDVEKFEKLAVVKGQGTKLSQTDYTLSDENPLSGNSYYRLKQTDFSGAISYSKVVSVNVPESATWTVYPNPSSGSEFMISFAPSDLGKDAYIKVQDLGGKEIFQIQATGLNTTQLRIVSPQTLSPGIYIVSVVVEQQVIRQKIMVH